MPRSGRVRDGLWVGVGGFYGWVIAWVVVLPVGVPFCNFDPRDTQRGLNLRVHPL